MNAIMGFMRLSTNVEAIQVNRKNLKAIKAFLGGEERRNLDYSIYENPIRIKVIQSGVFAKYRDWLVKDDKGIIEVVKAADFKNEYIKYFFHE